MSYYNDRFWLLKSLAFWFVVIATPAACIKLTLTEQEGKGVVCNILALETFLTMGVGKPFFDAECSSTNHYKP